MSKKNALKGKAEKAEGAPPSSVASSTKPDPNLASIAQGTRIDPSADAASVAAAGEQLVDALGIGLPSDGEIYDLIHRMEKASRTGHGLDSDRELLKEAAVVLRLACGIAIDEPVAPVAGPYGAVVNDPPIGQSLPPTK